MLSSRLYFLGTLNFLSFDPVNQLAEVAALGNWGWTGDVRNGVRSRRFRPVGRLKCSFIFSTTEFPICWNEMVERRIADEKPALLSDLHGKEAIAEALPLP